MKLIASLLATASVALIVPLYFPHVVAGCSNPSYRFGVVRETESNRQAADLAKSKFCATAGVEMAL